MKWVTNRDGALELHAAGTAVGGVWRARNGFLSAVWHPYKRLGFFDTGPEARHAVEAVVREKAK